jgi:hypothetical protein
MIRSTFHFLLSTIYLILCASVMVSCSSPNPVTLMEDEGSTTIALNDQPLVTYVHEETPVPEGVDPLFMRSAYIHPLRSPGGEVLTRIQPEDHYHHYGIWNPWTRTNFQGRQVDFWNIGGGQGTVRFAEYLLKFEEADKAGMNVRHEHIYFREDGSEGVAIDEVWKLVVHQPSDERYTLDMTVELSTPLDSGITLEAYRYGGGLGFRATERWGSDNSTILTSEGRKRVDADGTQGRWIRVEGESSVLQGRSGVLFMSHPENRAHPEPMRVWPPDQYERKGNVFVEFCPIRHEEWVLE